MILRPAKAPPWLLIPIGLGIVRITGYPGDLWWLLGPPALLLDIVTLLALLRIAQRFPLGSRQPARHLWPYFVAAAVFITTSVALQWWVDYIDPGAPHTDSPLHLAIGELISFLIWMGLAHAIAYVRRYRAAEADSLRVRLELAGAARKRSQAELRSFENELNPRFLIGALRSAASHAADPARGERLLVEIADVVRAARPVSRSASLGDEIDGLKPFLALEQERLGQQVTLVSRIEDDLLDEPLPPLVLPALAREALRTASGAGPTTIDVTASRVRGSSGELLQVDVARALQPGARPHDAEDGVLARTIEHLRSAYAGEAAIDVTHTDAGVRVRLSVPLEREGPAADATPASDDPSASSSEPTRASRAGLLLLAAFFGLILARNIFAGQTIPRSNGIIPPVHLIIAESLLGATIVTLNLFVAIRLKRRGFGKGLIAHAGAAVGIALASIVSKWIFTVVVGYPYPPFTLADAVGRAVGAITMYGVFAGIVGAFEYARRYRGAEEKGLLLQAELAEAERRRIDAELRALKAELNPHFMGNALTGAASLMHSDAAAARDVLTKLADAVGSVVSRVGTQEVTLQEEIDSLAPFIAVEQSRFGNRLSVQWDVDADARAARVPHLILQPLVENAVKHGLAAPNGGRILVGGRRSGERLELTVQDDGVGLEQARRAPNVHRGGVGLSNSRARLEQLYGSDATLQLESAAPQPGTIVKVTLPWR